MTGKKFSEAQGLFLDHHSTTPVRPEVLEEMIQHFSNPALGNPNSQSHAWGWRAAKVIQNAGHQLATALGRDSADEILWTSGATEGLFTAILGWHTQHRDENPLMATTVLEHPSAHAAFKQAQARGALVQKVGVDSRGHLRLDELEKLCRQNLRFFSFIYAHNEVGTVQKIDSILAILKDYDVCVHADLAQAVGKVPLDLKNWPLDFATLTAHKLGGPQGVGAVWIQPESRNQLEGLMSAPGKIDRLGTPPVALIAGLAKAVDLAQNELGSLGPRWRKLRGQLLEGLRQMDSQLTVNGCPEHHLPNNLNVSLPALMPHRMPALATKLAVSSGSACASQTPGSAALTALGVPAPLQRQTLRFGLGPTTDSRHIQEALQLLKPCIASH